MRLGRGILPRVVLLAMAFASSGCRQALSTVFDVPPPKDGKVQPVSRPAVEVPRWWAAEDTVRPAIERMLDPDSVRALLPRDHAGNIDWVAALRSGVIKPRSALPDRPPLPEDGFEFAFDFVYKGPDPTFDALFPHSVHTKWLFCQQCHPRIFRYRDTPVTMAEIFQGKFCAECHGKVAFPITTGCERCHRNLSQPADRAKPDLLGDIVMRRVRADSGAAAGLNVGPNELPSAVFPHWVHRIRFRCKVCHMEIFEPRAGANEVTMKAIADGQACGRCHNGATAFRATIGTCSRCHSAAETAAASR